jgi:hypothetical protein
VGKYGTNLEGFGAFEGGVNADKGAPLVSTSSDGETALLFGPAALREIQAGVANGDFAIPPDAAGDKITEENPLPYWTFTDVSSGGKITAAIVTDSASASGNVLRFSAVSGTNVGQDVDLTRYTSIPSSRDQAFAVVPEAYISAASGIKMLVSVYFSFYTSDYTLIGSEVLAQARNSVGQIRSNTLSPISSTAPSNAAFVLIRINVKITTSATTATETIDISELRLNIGSQVLLVAESTVPATYGPLIITQTSGNPAFQYGTRNATFSGDITISGQVSIGAANSLWVSRASVASATQSFTNNTGATVLLDTASTTPTTGTYDPKSWFNNANDRIVIGQAGFYTVTANIAFAANATGRRIVGINVNGTEVTSTTAMATPTGSSILCCTTNLYLALNDLVTMSGLQTSGGALSTVVVAGAYPALSVGRIGA